MESQVAAIVGNGALIWLLLSRMARCERVPQMIYCDWRPGSIAANLGDPMHQTVRRCGHTTWRYPRIRHTHGGAVH